MADTVAAITGASPEEAAGLLEMAGGNPEAAIALFFDMQGGGAPFGGGGGGGGGAAAEAQPSVPHSPAHAVLFGHAAAPAAWREQGFEFSAEPESRCGILQQKNGPCGVLAVVNAEVVAHLGCPLPSAAVDDPALCAAFAAILWRCAQDGRVVLAKWVDAVGGDVASQERLFEGAAEVAAELLLAAPSFTGRGGCLLFCYSCVLTRGADAVAKDAALDNGATPLVQGPHALCTTELINLMLTGVARGNVGAYDAGGAKVSWRPPAGAVGMLSRDELESGMPLADGLKSPARPIYVLHGGDHFTIAWAPASAHERAQSRIKALFGAMSAAGVPPNDAAARALAQAAEEARAAPPAPPAPPADAFDLALWNGLPPNRAMGWLRLRGCGEGAPHASAPAAPAQHAPTHWRLTVGEVESVVQASPEDKRAAPGCWREHAYEINLVTPAVAAEDTASAPRPEGAPPPLRLEPGAPPPAGSAWRCASCYNGRFKRRSATMCFGENPSPAASVCKFCGLEQKAAGFTLWKKYAELPPALQKRVDRHSGPKVLAVLRTRWPDAVVAAVAADGAVAELGTADCTAAKFTTPIV